MTHPPRDMAPLDEPTTVHVARARDGNADSLAWLVRRLSPWLLVQARHRLAAVPRPELDPEDLVQETWLATLPRLGELGARGGRRTPVLLSFLGSVLRNRVADLMRRRLRGHDAPVGRLADGQPLDELAATVTGVLAHIERSELQTAVDAAMRSLGAQAHELLVLRGIEQVPYSELESLLGVRANTLAVRYGRLLQQLRERLAHYGVEDLLSPD